MLESVPMLGTERSLRLLLAGLALAGLGIAAYLTVIHYEDGSPLCLAGGEGCRKVQESSYADLAGVPVPVIGLAGYLAILAMAATPGDPGRFGGLFAGLVGVGFSIYLTYIEIFEIEAICHWCVASAVVMTLVLIAAAIRALRYGGMGTNPNPRLGEET